MKLKDILKNQTNKSVKRTIAINDGDEAHEYDVYVKVLSCSDVMDADASTHKDALYTNVSKSILDEKGKEIFTVEQIKELPAYVWFQLLDVSNEVNRAGKTKP